MFHELFQIACQSTLSMLIAADAASGHLTISLTPIPRDKEDASAPREALTLTATPAEFEAEFVTSLRTYRTVLPSLREQTTATTARMTAAKPDKAAKAGAAKKTDTPLDAPKSTSASGGEPEPDTPEIQPDLFD